MGKKYTVLICLLLVAGLGVLFYPAVSSAINRQSGSYAIQEWEQQVGQLEDADRAEQLLLAQRYNDALLLGSEPEDYEAILNLGNGMMGYIRIPGIDVNLPIYHGVEEDTLAKGVGHLPTSSLPIGREGDHAVLTGHTGLPSARLFTDLTELQEGDRFYVHILEDTLCYQVDQIKVVLPTEGQDLAAVPGKDYCTLVTCTPYGINSHRLLVRGVRIQDETVIFPTEEAQEERKAGKFLWLILLLLLLAATAAVFIAKHWLDGRKKPPYNGKYLRK